MQDNEELMRIRNEYSDRELRLIGCDRYSLFNPAHLFLVQQRQRIEIQLLKRYHLIPLQRKRILEVGCGRGNVLIQYLEYSAYINSLCGIDILHERIQDAHQHLPNLLLSLADAQNLPYRSHTFDLVMQYTMFTSILDDTVKQNVAQEMLRVVRRNGGMILWYDFWINPINHKTRGILPVEIKRLFPHCSYEFHKTTLAPPLARIIVPVARGFAQFLESLKIFNTHYLVAICPQPLLSGKPL